MRDKQEDIDSPLENDTTESVISTLEQCQALVQNLTRDNQATTLPKLFEAISNLPFLTETDQVILFKDAAQRLKVNAKVIIKDYQSYLGDPHASFDLDPVDAMLQLLKELTLEPFPSDDAVEYITFADKGGSAHVSH